MSEPVPPIWLVQVAKPVIYAWAFLHAFGRGLGGAFRNARHEVRREQEAAAQWIKKAKITKNLGL